MILAVLEINMLTEVVWDRNQDIIRTRSHLVELKAYSSARYAINCCWSVRYHIFKGKNRESISLDSVKTLYM